MILIAGALQICVPAVSVEAQERPFEAKVQELVERAVRLGNSPRAMLPLLEIWQAWSDVPPEVATAAVERLANERRLDPAVRQYAAGLLARSRTRTGDPEASDREFDALGYLRNWRVVGPFDNEGKAGFSQEFAPERDRMAPIDPDARYEGRERAVSWRAFPPELVRYGYVSFDAVFRPDVNVCGYAETFVTSERQQALSLWLGGGGAIRVWWNGDPVMVDEAYRQPHPDRQVAIVAAQSGPNRLLVKACVTGSTWGFFARLGDPAGAPMSGLSSAPTGDASQVQRAELRLPRAPVAPLAALEQAAQARSASGTALEELARFLVYTGSDDPAEQRAKQLAARAAERQPTPERLILAAELATERGAAMGFVDRAYQLRPENPAVLLARARLIQGGPAPEDALPILDRIAAGTPEWMNAAALRADLWSSFGFPETARMVIEDAAAHAPRSPRWVALRAGAAEGVFQSDRAVELRNEIVELRYDDLGARRVLIADALTRGDRDTALRHLDVYASLGRDHVASYSEVASIYDSLGDEAAMFGAYRAALDLAPEDASVMVAYGQALLRAGRNDAATQVLHDALSLRPQDAETRELLEQIEPEERADEAYAASTPDILARVSENRDYPTRVLQNLTVNTVFESGLGSSFHQMAVQIVDDEGARSFRSFPIQFDPAVQRVTIRAARVLRDGQELEATQMYEQQLGEPWYRIWYDTRALVIVFPDLEPGDVVELRWRIDDVATRNQFDDYYGDIEYLAGSTPIEHLEYVLISPASREFYFNEPHSPSGPFEIEHERQVDGETRVDRFVATEIDAIRAEDNMPGMTEIVPYLHVSTYRTWEDVGRWYWGLIHDQLYADQHLQEVVRGLVATAPDLRTKVERIYEWVIRNTRYVGLEFGIHGFLPYRVPQIVERGFGDCKDKASLIYTMLREAGIEARIVLTRTRRNGAITDLPASLAVFDHAIAYVPELDLYLDGTAEHSGSTEFPLMDQGVTVLHVGPESAELRRTPVLPAERNRRTRQMDVRLSADGSARIRVQEEIRGSEAAGYRSTYQAEGTRRERFERSMRRLFPGVEVEAPRMTGLENYEEPVGIQYSATVPHMAIVDADGLRVRATVLDDLIRSFASSETRRYPLNLGGTTSYVEDREIHLPQGMQVLGLPHGGEAESPYGHLELRMEQIGDRVVAHTELSIDKDVIPASEYEAFREWVEQADRVLRERVVLGGGGR